MTALKSILAHLSLIVRHMGLYQTSCSYITQQNDVVECKNENLLEVSKTTLIHMHLARSFWSAFLLHDICMLSDQS